MAQELFLLVLRLPKVPNPNRELRARSPFHPDPRSLIPRYQALSENSEIHVTWYLVLSTNVSTYYLVLTLVPGTIYQLQCYRTSTSIRMRNANLTCASSVGTHHIQKEELPGVTGTTVQPYLVQQQRDHNEVPALPN